MQCTLQPCRHSRTVLLGHSACGVEQHCLYVAAQLSQSALPDLHALVSTCQRACHHGLRCAHEQHQRTMVFRCRCHCLMFWTVWCGPSAQGLRWGNAVRHTDQRCRLPAALRCRPSELSSTTVAMQAGVLVARDLATLLGSMVHALSTQGHVFAHRLNACSAACLLKA